MTQEGSNEQKRGKLLGRDSLMQPDSLKKEKVVIDEAGNYVFVRQMSGRERDNFEQSLFEFVVDQDGNQVQRQKAEDFRAKLAVQVICDEEGNNLLNADDIRYISTKWSADKLEKIAQVAQRLNRIGQKDREELEKNSKDGPSANSTLNSASN